MRFGFFINQLKIVSFSFKNGFPDGSDGFLQTLIAFHVNNTVYCIWNKKV
jgi:hypothetical protein